ncbi:dnaB-like helicase N terminal domain protein [Mycobacterium xenopi 4042]|uniref:DnaB-like helicase N terminal domain protein n=1 Tax=Mycobacterium xenopi 4042 TaxID=1299334 RepID=X8CKA6_MYCXE|nr:dnaB-like helicase N terminal domain protein [Mycobacterium xenopi 4042]
MAVVDDLGYPGMDAASPSEDFGRQPPQDLAAEQSVLGGMLLSKDAIADVLERLRPGDFYRPRTRTSTTRSWICMGAASRPMR